jgi:hypothetical protein
MDSISGLFRSTMWNETIPTTLRGRLAGIEMLSWSSGPTLGGAEAGAVGSLAGVRASVVSGGVLCIAGTAALVLVLPRFWHYDARTAVVAGDDEGGVAGDDEGEAGGDAFPPPAHGPAPAPG